MCLCCSYLVHDVYVVYLYCVCCVLLGDMTDVIVLVFFFFFKQKTAYEI